MNESDAMFNAAAAVLLAAFALRHSYLAPRLGRSGLAFVLVGIMAPLLDFVVSAMVTGDRIAMLTRPPLFFDPGYGLVLILALGMLAVFVTDPRTGAVTTLCLAGGYLLFHLLALITPAGVSPFSMWDGRISLPFFPSGHPLLLAILALTAVLMAVLRRFEGYIFKAGAALLLLYLLAGPFQYMVVSLQARELAGAGEDISIAPANIWPTRWLVTVRGDNYYRLYRHGLDMGEFEEGEEHPIWNDETLLLNLLGDPVIRHFYYRRFHNPLVKAVRGESRTTLVIRELADQNPPTSGRVFYYEMEPERNLREYQVTRFD